MHNDQNILTAQGGHEEAQWISLSDLMTGLMMIFLLIAIIFMLNIQKDVNKASTEFTSDHTSDMTASDTSSNTSETVIMAASAQAKKNAQSVGNPKLGQPLFSAESIQQEIEAQRIPATNTIKADDSAQTIALTYDNIKKDLYFDLSSAFNKNLKTWGAEIDEKNLTVRFNDPGVLFNTGEASLRPKFEDILRDFFPRYVSIITSPKYKGVIKEVRIEGHTSSHWNGTSDEQEAYFRNMELSQARTRSTLREALGLTAAQQQSGWLKSHLTANGLSSSHPIRNEDGSENVLRSQRVEFRILTDSDERLDSIANLQTAQ